MFSFNCLYFYVISCNLSSFISDCVYLGPLLFAWWSCLRAYRFCLSFKEPAPGFIDPYNRAFSLYVIQFCSDLGYFLPSTCSGLCCCSSSSCVVELSFLFETFPSFLGWPVLLWTSLTGLCSLCPIDSRLLCVHFNLFPETFLFLPWYLIYTFIV